MSEVDRLASEIGELPPADKLHLAAGLVEHGRLAMARAVVERALVEMAEVEMAQLKEALGSNPIPR